MIKVLHVLEHSFPRLAGYTVRSKNIVDNQRMEDIKPVVITSPLQEKTDRSYREPELIDGIRYYRTGEFNRVDIDQPMPIRLLRRYLYSKEYGKAIGWVAKKEGSQIIHSHSSYLNGIRGNEAARKLGVLCVYEVRGLWQDTAVITERIDARHWKYKFIDYMDRRAMLGANRVISISNQLKIELIAKGVPENRISVVPNGVDTKIFKPQEKNPDIMMQYGLEGKLVFGFVGSIRKIEGLALFLENMPKILKRKGQIKAMFVGGGEEVARLKMIAREKGLQEHTVFSGQVSHDKVLDYYSVLDILLYPRIDAKVNQKVTPLKPLEAMAMEKVVLASDVGGLTELVKDGKNGFLFRADDGDDLMRRCLDLVNNPALRQTVAKSARSWVLQERDWSKIIKLYNGIYQDLLGICT